MPFAALLSGYGLVLYVEGAKSRTCEVLDAAGCG